MRDEVKRARSVGVSRKALGLSYSRWELSITGTGARLASTLDYVINSPQIHAEREFILHVSTIAIGGGLQQKKTNAYCTIWMTCGTR